MAKPMFSAEELEELRSANLESSAEERAKRAARQKKVLSRPFGPEAGLCPGPLSGQQGEDQCPEAGPLSGQRPVRLCREEERSMWKKLLEEHPVLFEAVNWGVLILSVGTFALALRCYAEVVL